jgi:hypothetical protein
MRVHHGYFELMMCSLAQMVSSLVHAHFPAIQLSRLNGISKKNDLVLKYLLVQRPPTTMRQVPPSEGFLLMEIPLKARNPSSLYLRQALSLHCRNGSYVSRLLTGLVQWLLNFHLFNDHTQRKSGCLQHNYPLILLFFIQKQSYR